jgi:2-polyprenyl-3-methyl-5-hydroxy-6-metoxy-1,4-benzoquinol methylase
MTNTDEAIPNSGAYRTSAEYYDVHAPDDVADFVDFWEFTIKNHAKRPIADVLEFGVGTGRIAIPLAARGHCVSGLDGSPEMLEVCRRRAHAAGTQLTLRQQWIQDFHEVESHDALIAVFGAVGFLVHDQAIRQFFAACQLALRPGGFLLIEVANSFLGLTDPWAGIHRSTYARDGKVMERFLQMVPHTLDGTVTYRDTAIVTDGAKSVVYKDEFVLRMFTWPDLRLLLEPIRFSRVTCYGGWSHRKPMLEPAPRLIVVLEKH